MLHVDSNKKRLEELTDQFNYDDYNRCNWTISKTELFIQVNPSFKENIALRGALDVLEERVIRGEQSILGVPCQVSRRNGRGYEGTMGELVSEMRRLEVEIKEHSVQAAIKTITGMETVVRMFEEDSDVKKYLAACRTDCALYHVHEFLREILDEAYHRYYKLTGDHNYGNLPRNN